MSDQPKISQTHTACKNCVFAQYEGNTQVGCELGRIDDYKEAGVEVFEVYDEEKEFNIINRFCLFYRTPDVMGDTPREQWAEKALLDTKIPYHVMLFVNKGDTIEDVRTSLDQLINQDVKPNMVSIVNKQYHHYNIDPENNIKPSKMLNMLEKAGFHQYTFKNVYDARLDDRDLIDLVFDGSKDLPLAFYMAFRVGFNIPPEMSTEFNNAISIRMLQIGFARPVDDLNGLIGNRVTHKKHAGNSFKVNLEAKIKKFEDNGSKFIFDATDICPSLGKIDECTTD